MAAASLIGDFRGSSPILPLDLVRLRRLMELSTGSPNVLIGLIDGPVDIDHPDIGVQSVTQASAGSGHCNISSSAACSHGTFVAGILVSKRESAAPAICPDCQLIVRPIFPEFAGDPESPRAAPAELAQAIEDCVNAGTRLINISAMLMGQSNHDARLVAQALTFAAHRNVLVVAAAGNQGYLQSSAVTEHPWVIPVVGYDSESRPMQMSNIGHSIGTRGIGAPGHDVVSLKAGGQTIASSGTSVAAPFVTGTLALLLSLFPQASVSVVRHSLFAALAPRRKSVVPPLLNAQAAYNWLSSSTTRITYS